MVLQRSVGAIAGADAGDILGQIFAHPVHKLPGLVGAVGPVPVGQSHIDLIDTLLFIIGGQVGVVTLNHRHQNQHRAHADDNAQHGQKGAHLFVPNGLKGHTNRIHTAPPLHILVDGPVFIGHIGPVLYDLAVLQPDNTPSFRGNAVVMGNEDNGGPLPIQLS